MFGQNKSRTGNSELTSLNLSSDPVPQPQTSKESSPAPPQGPKPTLVPPCLQLAFTPEVVLFICRDFQRQFDEWVKKNPKPQVIFYLVLPQQGHPVSISSNDGSKTTLLLFGSTWMANAFAASRGLKAVTAGCRLESLPQQAEKWIAAGINSFALNPCPKCGNAPIYPVAELQSEEQFLRSFGQDAVNRRIYGGIIVRNCQARLSDQKFVRNNLERLRDHLDYGNPYVHWMIAAFAGMAGDKEASNAAIDQLEQFGPPFIGKIKRDPSDPMEPGSPVRSVAEGIVGLLASYGILNVPMKPAGD
ncbi:MAG: hypothetical protein JOZ33_00160 [Acidobacteriaceae bacterium]|nr:hypothetical protein [Acidobacteriaceae bacterium]